MLLETHRWGEDRSDAVVCLHGVTQHGRVFAELARRLEADGRSVVAVDLRGHGGSGHQPPWDSETQVDDVLETIDAAGAKTATWVGHSFGGRLAAGLAARVPERSEGLVLLDPAIGIPPAIALHRAEIDRLDWSFATADGAVNAMLSSDLIVAAPRGTIAAFVQDDIRKGFRRSLSPRLLRGGGGRRLERGGAGAAADSRLRDSALDSGDLRASGPVSWTPGTGRRWGTG